MPTFLAITPVRTIKLPTEASEQFRRRASPKSIRAPPGLELRQVTERRGRSPECFRRYHPMLRTISGARRRLSQLNLHVDAGRQVELHQRVDGLRRRLHDIEQPLVGPDLELLARLLVDVRRAVDGELLDARRQG